MREHSGIAAWKGLGFYDVNISKGLSEIIKHNQTKMDKLNEIGMKGAEFADDITWAAIWNACKMQVEKSGTKSGEESFFDRITPIANRALSGWRLLYLTQSAGTTWMHSTTTSSCDSIASWLIIG